MKTETQAETIWVIVGKITGLVMLKTRRPEIADKICRERFHVYTSQEWRAKLNKEKP